MISNEMPTPSRVVAESVSTSREVTNNALQILMDKLHMSLDRSFCFVALGTDQAFKHPISLTLKEIFWRTIFNGRSHTFTTGLEKHQITTTLDIITAIPVLEKSSNYEQRLIHELTMSNLP